MPDGGSENSTTSAKDIYCSLHKFADHSGFEDRNSFPDPQRSYLRNFCCVEICGDFREGGVTLFTKRQLWSGSCIRVRVLSRQRANGD
jgi:hypothetical protein